MKDNRIPSTTTPISRFDYSVNGINQRTQVETTGSAFPTQPADWNWGYDALGQVITANSPTSTFDRAYTYDQIGNRTKSADGALVTTGSSATVYDANNLNQYSQISVPSVQSVVPIHDQDGNATSYPLPVAPTTNATLGYDGENRLISVTTGGITVTYAYDSQSRRIARTQGSNTTVYLYDAWNCLAEYSLETENYELKTSYTWGLDLSVRLQGAGGVGGLLAVNLSSSVFYPTYDGNGNVSEYLTASGTIAAHFEYDPFGRTIVASLLETENLTLESFPYRFSTKAVDPSIGLYYYGYRWYDPLTGRWPSKDPVEESGGGNLYGFVANQGTVYVDYLGLALVMEPIQESNLQPHRGGWFGATGAGENGKNPLPVGDENDARPRVDPNYKDCKCVKVTASKHFDVKVTTTIYTATLGVDFDYDGLNYIIAHEEKRRSVYLKGYNAYFKIFEADIIGMCDRCQLTGTEANTYLRHLKKWLHNQQAKMRAEYARYVTTEQGVTDGGRGIYKNIGSENDPKTWIRGDDGVFRGGKTNYIVKEPKQVKLDPCPPHSGDYK